MRRVVAVAVRPVVRGEAGGAAPARTVPVARPVITRCRPGLFDVLGLTAWGGRGGGGGIGGGRARIGMRRGLLRFEPVVDLSLLQENCCSYSGRSRPRPGRRCGAVAVQQAGAGVASGTVTPASSGRGRTPTTCSREKKSRIVEIPSAKKSCHGAKGAENNVETTGTEKSGKEIEGEIWVVPRSYQAGTIASQTNAQQASEVHEV